MFFFFFFQAEDGIRDRDVTGVQTCALPISPGSGRAPPRAARARGQSAPRPPGRARGQGARAHATKVTRLTSSRVRSEERRVGKECRCRMAAGDEKKRENTGRIRKGRQEYT